MDLRQLKYFTVIAQTQSFSRAAELLNIAQPALSRQIQQLEEDLQVTLINRETRPISLTNAGVFFLDQTTKILHKLNDITISTKRLDAGGRTWMGVGFVPSTLYGFLPKVMRRFSSTHPEIDVTLSEMTSLQQADALKSYRIDIGFGRVPIQDDFISNVVLAREALVAAVPSPGPLSDLATVGMLDLLQETLILYPVTPRPSFADQVLKQFSVRGYAVQNILETNGLHTALGMVAAGIGTAFVPSSVQTLQRADIAYRPIAENGLETQLIMSVRNGEMSTQVKAFQSVIFSTLRA